MAWFWLADIALITFVGCLVLASRAGRLGLLAVPDEHRQHGTPTPMVGGIAIFLGLLAGCLLIDDSYKMLLPSLFLLCAVGAVDDYRGLPFWVRFLAQAIAAYLMVVFTGVELTSLGFLVSDNELRLGQWSIPLTIFAVVGVINAVNMSDGMDGLAGCLILLLITSLLLLGSPDKGLLLISASAMIGFLVLNVRVGRRQAKVFMGDAGSTMLGLLVAYLLINASQNSDSIAPVTALWLLALPLIDAVGVLIVRPLKGRSSFSADRIHYHHQLLDFGLSVNVALLLALVLQLIFVAIGVASAAANTSQASQFYLFLLVFVLYFLVLIRKA